MWKLLLLLLLICTLAEASSSGYISVMAYRTGGQTTNAQLVTTRGGSEGCREHKTIACELSGVSPSPTGAQLSSSNFNYATSDNCPSSSGSSSACWNGTSPPPISYQIIHPNASFSWILQLYWSPPPQDSGCIVSRYDVLVYTQKFEESGLSTCQSMVNKNALIAGTISHIADDSTYGYFKQGFSNTDDSYDDFHIKVVGHPSFEYPLLHVKVPQQCDQEYFFGCSNCLYGGGCEPRRTQPNISVYSPSLSLDQQSITVNISLLSIASDVNEYFLHTKTSRGKHLHRLDDATQHIVVSDLPVDNDTFIWMEQFTCGCSNATPFHQIILYNDNTLAINEIDFIPEDSELPLSSSTVPVTILPSISNALTSLSYYSDDPIITSSIDLLLTVTTTTVRSVSSSSYYSSLSGSSFSSPSSSPPTSPSIDNRSPYLILSITLPLVLLLTAIVIIVSISLVFISKYRRSSNKFTSDLPPPLSPVIHSSSSSNELTSITTYPPVNVIAIIPHDTCQNDKEAYLAFLDDLVLQGAQLQVYCRSNRTTPADWLQSVFTHDSLVLVIINKQFYFEWNGDVISDVPVVFALKQLMHSLTQQSRDLRNFALILPHPTNDKEYIPDSYLFHTVQQFALEDTEGMSRFVFKVPEFTVDSSSC